MPGTLREYHKRKKALSKTEGALIASDLAALERSLRVFETNCGEFLRLQDSTNDPETALQLWAVQNREGFERYLDEVDRLFHNVVSAAASLKNHSIRIRDKWMKPDSNDQLREQHDARVMQVFTESRTAQLIEGLRNIVQHRKFPRLLGHAEHAPGKPFKSKIIVDPDTLLEWDRWSASIREFLADDDHQVVLDELVVEYRDAVRDFHEWFSRAVRQRNGAALTKLEQGKRELVDYQSSLFGPPWEGPGGKPNA